MKFYRQLFLISSFLIFAINNAPCAEIYSKNKEVSHHSFSFKDLESLPSPNVTASFVVSQILENANLAIEQLKNNRASKRAVKSIRRASKGVKHAKQNLYEDSKWPKAGYKKDLKTLRKLRSVFRKVLEQARRAPSLRGSYIASDFLTESANYLNENIKKIEEAEQFSQKNL